VAGPDAIRFLIEQSRSAHQHVLRSTVAINNRYGHLEFLRLGYERKWIQRKLMNGERFRVVSWQEGHQALGATGANVVQAATWEGIAAVAAQHYGQEIGARVSAQLQALRITSFDDIEAKAAVAGGFLGSGGSYFAINESAVGGISQDERYMTPERYLASDGGLAATRGFFTTAWVSAGYIAAQGTLSPNLGTARCSST